MPTVSYLYFRLKLRINSRLGVVRLNEFEQLMAYEFVCLIDTVPLSTRIENDNYGSGDDEGKQRMQ